MHDTLSDNSCGDIADAPAREVTSGRRTVDDYVSEVSSVPVQRKVTEEILEGMQLPLLLFTCI